MKKKTFRNVLFFAAAVLVAAAGSVFRGFLFAGDGVITDNSGNTASWSLDWTGKLTIGCDGAFSCGFSDALALGRGDGFPSSNVKHVRSIVVEEGVTEIGGYAFSAFTRVREITLPDSVKTIGERAFPPYAALGALRIPAGVTEISPEAFVSCHKLREIVVDEKNPSYASENGVLFNKDKTALLCCPPAGGGTAYIVAPQVTRIGDLAFSDCGRLTRIDLPEGVAEIGDCAFEYCTALTEMTLPEGVARIGFGAFINCDQLTKVVLPDSAAQLGERIFSCCKKLTQVRLPAGIAVIPEGMFDGCESLTEFTVPDSVARIEADAFSGTGIRELTVPEGVTYIGTNAFIYCPDLTSLTIPSTVAELGVYPFGESELLKDIYYGGTRAQWQALLDSTEESGLAADVNVHFTGN